VKEAVATIDPEERIQIGTVAIGGELFGLDIMRIREIVRPIPTTPIPGSPVGVVGVIRLRGLVLPVVDLRARFALSAAKPKADEQRFVVVTVDGRRIALVVDRVGDVVTVSRRDIRLARDTLSGASARFFVGIVTFHDRIVLLLNATRVLADAARIDLETLVIDFDREVAEFGDDSRRPSGDDDSGEPQLASVHPRDEQSGEN
jgi:purine-binding chemotaxis protein CheW